MTNWTTSLEVAGSEQSDAGFRVYHANWTVDWALVPFHELPPDSNARNAHQTPSLPDARPRSDCFRCGGRESEFLL